MKPIILGLGTCIAQHLVNGIKMLPECEDKFAFHYFFGGVDRVAAPIPLDILKHTVLIIEDLGPWQPQTHLSPDESQMLPADVLTIRVPTLHFNSLWPFLKTDPRNKISSEFPWGKYPTPWSDGVAIDVIARHSRLEDRLKAYQQVDIASLIDLDHFHNLQIVNMFVREAPFDLHVGACVSSSFDRDRLYYEHHHPSGKLLAFLLCQIYGHPKFLHVHRGDLGAMTRTARSWTADSDPFRWEQVPIHPHVARHFDLKWWSPDIVYWMMGRAFTFEEWIAYYMTEDIVVSPCPAL